MQQQTIEIIPNYDINDSFIYTDALVNNILQGRKIRVSYHRDLAGIVTLVTGLGVSIDTVNFVINMSSHPSRFDIARDIKYILYLRLVAPQLIDSKAMLVRASTHNAYMKALCNGVMDINNNTEMGFKLINVFNEYNFIEIFDHYDVEVGKTVEAMNRYRTKCIAKCMVNPLSLNPVYKAPEVPYIEIPAIFDPRTAVVGSPVFTPGHNYTADIIKYSFGILSDFPWEIAVLAGGYVEKILSGNIEKHPEADIDIFVLGITYDMRKANFNTILNFLSAKGTCYYAIKGSVVNVYIVGINRTFQIISSDKTSIYQIISNFDNTHIAWAFDGTQFQGLYGSYMALCTGVSMWMNTKNSTSIRIVKTFNAGYMLEKEPKNEALNVDELLMDIPQLESILCQISTYWYPTTNKRMFNLGMCEKDSGFAVTDDIKHVSDTMVIGGNFELTYDNYLFSIYNVAKIDKPVFGKARCYMAINKRTSKILSDDLTIRSITTKNDIVIGVSCSEAFGKFIDSLFDYHKINFKINHQDKTQYLNNVFEFTITEQQLILAVEAERTLFKTKTRQPLTIGDFKVGDKINILFKVLMQKYTTKFTKHITICPLSVYKVSN